MAEPVKVTAEILAAPQQGEGRSQQLDLGKWAYDEHRCARPIVDPVVLARIGNLELVARWVVEGFISGLHRSPHFGFSTDFAEHRQYMPGDDIRHFAALTAMAVEQHHAAESRIDESRRRFEQIGAERGGRDGAGQSVLRLHL